MNTFKVGDVVRLKSGSPQMTVTEARDGQVWTAWFIGAESKTGYFPAAAVEAPPARGISELALDSI
jgi:uncharacterized protein YodC (DUF2158 family)